nr:hypothetical protein [Methyloferula stellata]
MLEQILLLRVRVLSHKLLTRDTIGYSQQRMIVKLDVAFDILLDQYANIVDRLQRALPLRVAVFNEVRDGKKADRNERGKHNHNGDFARPALEGTLVG